MSQQIAIKEANNPEGRVYNIINLMDLDYRTKFDNVIIYFDIFAHRETSQDLFVNKMGNVRSRMNSSEATRKPKILFLTNASQDEINNFCRGTPPRSYFMNVNSQFFYYKKFDVYEDGILLQSRNNGFSATN